MIDSLTHLVELSDSPDLVLYVCDFILGLIVGIVAGVWATSPHNMKDMNYHGKAN